MTTIKAFIKRYPLLGYVALERLSQQLGRSPVAAVPEEVRNVSVRYRRERPAHRFDQRFARASAPPSIPLTFEKACSMGLNSGESRGVGTPARNLASR